MGDEEAVVQSYLAKHKISFLFEDLMSKVVKDLPANPIDFIISKLQISQRQRKKGPPLAPASATSPAVAKVRPGKTNITGISSTTKLPVKSPVTDRLSKSATGPRPVRPANKSSLPLPSRTTPSRTTPTRASPATPGKLPASSGTKSKTTPSKTTPSKFSATSRPISSSAASKTPSKSSIPIAGRASSKRVALSSPRSSGASLSVQGNSSLSRSKARPPDRKKTDTSTTTSIPTSSTSTATPITTSTKKSKELEVEEPKVEAKLKPKEEEIDEFFGEAKKSSQKKFYLDSDEEEDSALGVEEEGEVSDECEAVEKVSLPEEKMHLDIHNIRKKKYCKQSKKSCRANLQLILEATGSNLTTPLSMGYHDDTESDDGGEGGVELLEDADALRDEGVDIARGDKYATKTTSVREEQPLFCARCARAIDDDDDDDDDDVVALSSEGTAPECEGVSQVSLGSCGEEDSASEREQDDTLSEVTFQSQDTWGGLGPPSIPPQLTSDEESEVHLPPPPPLQGHSWSPDTPIQHDPHGWGQNAD